MFFAHLNQRVAFERGTKKSFTELLREETMLPDLNFLITAPAEIANISTNQSQSQVAMLLIDRAF